MIKRNKMKGFTLIELAIVLVIVGLLVGGVLQGQELIKQSQIRSVVSQVQEMDTAINTFRAKYSQYPGDISNASAFGINCPRGVVCNGTNDNVSDVVAAGTDGSDGDGDGDFNLEDYHADATDETAYDTYGGEIANFWVHLSNTLLVRGNYIQTDDCSTACGAVVGTNFPSSPIGNGMIALSEAGRVFWVIGTGTSVADLDGGAADADSPTAQQLTPEEAYGLDSKLDDGAPDSGIVRATASYNVAADGFFADDTTGGNGCFTAAGTYALATEAKRCTIRVRASG
ncbi:MAG: prepilin-type N-terminal cleavage/methylation domain-containing protein [Rickettsiales bacterium]|nr:prepilin-type N-terminal cleavage/methylation domain-containing protein [Rickettsiales bacterium]